MACSICGLLTPDELCTTIYPTLNPCRCDSPAGIRETGPQGVQGIVGVTPHFSIGTVTGGNASVDIVSTGAERVMNFGVPAVPEGVSYVWTKKQTYQQTSIEEAGVSVTGGTSTFGGTGFEVTPDATFSGDVSTSGNNDVAGDANASTDLLVDGNLYVGESTSLDDVSINGLFNLEPTTLSLSDIAEYPAGTLVLSSCGNMQQQPNVGRGLFTKADATGLTAINPVNSGAICSPISITVPVSTCVPQVTPLVRIKVRVTYRFGSSGNLGVLNKFTCALWQGSIGTGTQIDFYDQGDGAFNSDGGFFELFAQATLAAGANPFNVEVENNDAGEVWTPTQVTYIFQN